MCLFDPSTAGKCSRLLQKLRATQLDRLLGENGDVRAALVRICLSTGWLLDEFP